LTLAFRVVTLPIRATPLRRYLRIDRLGDPILLAARRQYRKKGRAVTVVIPSYRDAELVARLVHSIRRTTRRGRVQIIVTDDCSGSDHIAALRRIRGITVIESAENTGFAANVNRGIRAADPTHDIVLLNSDVVAIGSWLAVLQFCAGDGDYTGVVGARLLYPDGRIQFGGTVRNIAAPEWFDHRFRFKPGNYPPAAMTQPALAVTGACMYIRRGLIDEVGLFDEHYAMAYEDVDYCLRCWQAERPVVYAGSAVLEHGESLSRGTEVGERERSAQRYFWQRWGEFLDAREVRGGDGELRIVYVTEDMGVGGGHRDIFEQANRLAARGHDVSIFTLGEPPDWFELVVPVRRFKDYGRLLAALEPLAAIKVATWWNTAAPVWLAGVRNGIPAYFVQDIETSYYPHHEHMRAAVIASYRHEFAYMTISGWNRDRLAELGLAAELVAPGVDLEMFRPRPDVRRREDSLLALGRTLPLKNFPLTLAAWHALGEQRPELRLFGIEPELANEPGIRYERRPSDDRVAELFSEASVFVQTSTHEGFCLPVLEAMACGTPVVCTDADGNRDFCVDGENCLMVAPRVDAVAGAIARLLADVELRERLAQAGLRTAASYSWESQIDRLERFLTDVATPHRVGLDEIALPVVHKEAR
jgi:GT2 family glycosyltransferase/glycosyltransferase involved in cell wall biosynthesis